MGSQPIPLAAVAPQQLLPPLFTRSAAWPYFSLTTCLTPTFSMFVAPSLPVCSEVSIRILSRFPLFTALIRSSFGSPSLDEKRRDEQKLKSITHPHAQFDPP